MAGLPKLKQVPEFERSVARFETWWKDDLLDRPPLTIGGLPPVRQPRPIQRHHASKRDAWLDAEAAVERSAEWLSCLEFVGDSFPVYMPNVGPELTATLYGCELEFSDHSSWSKPIVHQPEDWEKVLATKPNFDNIYWQTIEKMDKLALQCCENKFLVGITDLHGNYDILAALRDPETLCLDVLDMPDTLQRVDRHLARGFVESFERQYQLLSPAGQGFTSWAPYFHPGPVYLPSSDFWCMLSTEQAKELVLPDLLTEIQPLERSLFHLDGPQALRHLDLLLQIPNLTAIQWVYGASNGPARRWIDVYKKCVAAGKPVQVLANDPADALAVLEAVGPRGLWLCVGQLKTRKEAESFVQEVKQRS